MRSVSRSVWFQVCLVCVVFVTVQTFVARIYLVPSGSMEQTLKIDDRIVVDRMSYRLHSPATGDIVVFKASTLWEPAPPPPRNPVKYAVKWLGGVVGVGPSLDHVLVKRIVAEPGDVVSCCDVKGRVLLNGHPLSESYISHDLQFSPGALDCATVPRSQRCFPQVRVGAGEYLVMGDHRSSSNDSVFGCRGSPASLEPSCFKFVGRADIVGRVAAIGFPLSRWRIL